MEPSSLGWEPHLISWVNSLPKTINDFQKMMLRNIFKRFCEPLLWLIHKGGVKEICPTSDHNLVVATMKLCDCFLDDFKDEKFVEQISDLDIRAQLEGVFFFSTIWSLGGTLDVKSRSKFNLMFRGLLEREFPDDVSKALELPFDIPRPEKPYIFLPPSSETVFDYRYIKEVSFKIVETSFIQIINLGKREMEAVGGGVTSSPAYS